VQAFKKKLATFKLACGESKNCATNKPRMWIEKLAADIMKLFSL
jgi:hypothetical protein